MSLETRARAATGLRTMKGLDARLQYNPTEDVTEHPVYLKFVRAQTPIRTAGFAIDADTSRAKRIATFDVDLGMAMLWLETMQHLLSQDLTDAEFTGARMAHLAEWNKARKRLGHNLHWPFDARRRNPSLVRRETRAQLAKNLDEKFARLKLALEEQMTAFDEAGRRPPHSPAEDGSVMKRGGRELGRPATRREPTYVRDLSGVPSIVISTIADDLGVDDLTRVTDEQIREHYDRYGEGVADQYLAILASNPKDA